MCWIPLGRRSTRESFTFNAVGKGAAAARARNAGDFLDSETRGARESDAARRAGRLDPLGASG